VVARSISVPAAEFTELDVPAYLAAVNLTAQEVLEAFLVQAHVLAMDAWELTWSEITEELVESHEMECDGLGRFIFDPDRGTVRFNADNPFKELTAISVMGEESVWSVAMVAGAEGMALATETILALPSPVNTIDYVSQFLRNAGGLAVQQAITRSTPEAAVIAAHATAAFISYQAVVWSLGRQLQAAERIEVPLIGTFTSSLDVVSFAASPDLIDMLIANDRISW
jgi:hypothetical protein